LTFVVLLVTENGGVLEKKSGNGLAEGCFTDVLLHSSKSYHQGVAYATTPAI